LLISTAWYVDVPSLQTDLAQLGIPAIPDRNARWREESVCDTTVYQLAKQTVESLLLA